MTSKARERLQEIAQNANRALEKGLAPQSKETTIRELLGWYRYARRGVHVVARIRKDLKRFGLRTVPDFEYGWIDQRISIELDRTAEEGSESASELDDPTVRIGALTAAHREPVVVDPDHSLADAVTLMMENDFNQLPVTKDLRKVRGVVSWRSIGSRLSLGLHCRFVRNCMDPARETRIGEPLFTAFKDITKHGYTLVRDETEKISGIVTVADVGDQFLQLAGPFLAIGEIEGYLRALVHRKFTLDELKDASYGPDGESDDLTTSDLNFGAYCRLLENEKRWKRIGLTLSRGKFVERLNKVREIRNDVMHFDPDGLQPEERETLDSTVSLFRDLRRMGVL